MSGTMYPWLWPARKTRDPAIACASGFQVHPRLHFGLVLSCANEIYGYRHRGDVLRDYSHSLLAMFTFGHRSVSVAMALVWMVQMAIDQIIIDVIAVRHRFVTAVRAVDVHSFMTFAVMAGVQAFGNGPAVLQHPA